MIYDNLIEGIFTLIQKDTQDPMKQSELLEHYYTNAIPSEQKIIDTIMVCLCGYSLDTLINHPENIKT